MTYLQLINGVLSRLREDTVSSVTESNYSTLIASLVNDAKRLVEDAWQWSHLRTEIDVVTADGTLEYSLTGAGNNFTIDFVSIPVYNVFLSQRDNRWLRKQRFNTTATGLPSTYVNTGVDANGDMTVGLWIKPDAAYTVTFEGWQRQSDLSSEDDVLTVPSQPVLLLAVALAARERGEVGGQTAAELFGIAQQSLGDAIAHDAAKNEYDNDWYVQ